METNRLYTFLFWNLIINSYIKKNKIITIYELVRFFKRLKSISKILHIIINSKSFKITLPLIILYKCHLSILIPHSCNFLHSSSLVIFFSRRVFSINSPATFDLPSYFLTIKSPKMCKISYIILILLQILCYNVVKSTKSIIDIIQKNIRFLKLVD